MDDQDSSNKKLEWMYKGQSLNRDEYLLGRRIDKTFEQLNEEEKTQTINNPAITVPKNHVEHEVIPFSIRQYKGLPGTEQVDMTRKLMEDPLMLIKQKEMETRRKILENPVRLKEIHRMLKQEKDKKSSKKEKKSKKKKKKHSRCDSESDVDLDRVLAEKYQKLQGALQKEVDSDDSDDVDKLLSMKYDALSKELDKMTGGKKKKKKKQKKRDSSNDSNNSDDFHVTSKKNKDESLERKRRRSRTKSPIRQIIRRSRTPEMKQHRVEKPFFRKNERPRSRERYVNRFGREEKWERSPQRGFVRNNYNERQRSRSRSFDRRNRSSDRRRPIEKPQRRSPSPPKKSVRKLSPIKPVTRKRSPSSSSSSSDSSSPQQPAYDSDSNRHVKKAFGLVRSDGKQIELKQQRRQRSRTPEKLKKPTSSSSSTNKQFEVQKPNKSSKLSQEEINQRLKEMTSNASWREKERSEKVRKHREHAKREEEEETRNFDKDFLTKQLKKTATSTISVESRIKSNLNNIQRSSRTMDTHFARR